AVGRRHGDRGGEPGPLPALRAPPRTVPEARPADPAALERPRLPLAPARRADARAAVRRSLRLRREPPELSRHPGPVRGARRVLSGPRLAATVHVADRLDAPACDGGPSLARAAHAAVCRTIEEFGELA